MRSVLTLGAMVLAVLSLAAAPPDPEPFALAFRGQTFPFRDVSTFVMPDATLVFEAVGGPAGTYGFSARDGTLVQTTARTWRWTAPSTSGLYTLKIDDPKKKDTITLRKFVSERGKLRARRVTGNCVQQQRDVA